MNSTHAAVVSSIYLAYYGRPADPAGLAWWVSRLEEAEGSLDSIIQAFSTSTEAEARFDSLEAAERIRLIYRDLLDREPEEEGLSYWVEEILSGQRTIEELALAVYEGAQDKDKVILDIRQQFADALTARLATEGVAYDGQVAIDAARLLTRMVDVETSAADIDMMTAAGVRLIQIASLKPEVVQAISGSSPLTDLLKNEKAAADQAGLVQLITEVAVAANGDAQALKMLLGNASLDEYIDALPAHVSLNSAALTVAKGGLDAGAALVRQDEAPDDDTPAPPPETGDTSAPQMESAEISADGLVITIRYSEPLSGTVETGHFSLSKAVVITSAEIAADNESIVLTLERPIPKDALIEIAYLPPVRGNGLQDAAGNNAQEQQLAENILNGSLVLEDEVSTGIAQDGYLRGATVFMDMDSDGFLDEDEPQTVTDYSGNFTLYGGKGGTLIVFGGTDISTGLANTGVFKAPPGSTVVNPLTTLVAEIAAGDTADDIAAAQSQVLAALGLPDGFDLMHDDPLGTTLSESASIEAKQDALQVQAASIQVANLIAATTKMLSDGTDSAGTLATAQHVAKSVADAVKAIEADRLDLASSDVIADIMSTASGSKGSVSAASDAATALAMVNGAINTAVTAGVNEPSQVGAALESVVKAQIVAQGQLADALSAAGGSDLGGAFDSDSIESAIQDAQVGELRPDLKEDEAPFIIGTTPADDTMNVPSMARLTLTFNKSVLAEEGGTITLNAEDGRKIVLSVTDTHYVVVQDNVVHVDPKVNLGVLTKYYVTISVGAFVDQSDARMPFKGIADPTTLNFTTTLKNTIIGTDDGENLYGTIGNDVIHALDGDDWVDAGPGNDIVNGGGGHDYLIGGMGDDELNGGDGDDVLYDYSGSNRLNGGAGDDLLQSEQGSVLTGGDGADIFEVWYDYNDQGPSVITDFDPESDKVDIRDLIDSRLYDYSGGNPFGLGYLRLVQSGTDTLLQFRHELAEGEEGFQTLLRFENLDRTLLEESHFLPAGMNPDGSAAPGVVLVGTEDWESLYGTVGNDDISGGAGNDYLEAGPGNDTVDGGSGDDQLRGGLGDDWLKGGEGDDHLYDWQGNNILEGGDGNDTIQVSLGDRATGGQGADIFVISPYGGAEPIVITDFKAGDKLDVRDVIYSLNDYQGGNLFQLGFLALQQDGEDTLILLDRDGPDGIWDELTHFVTLENVAMDTLTSESFLPAGLAPDGSGAETNAIEGTDYSEVIDGSVGNDVIHALDGDDVVNAGAGHDMVFGGAGDDRLYGDLGNDALYGGEGNDVLWDFQGTNILDGGAGDDTLQGRMGDSFIGGAGRDTFQVNYTNTWEETGPAIIEDFDLDDDIIDLDSLLNTAVDYSGGNPFDQGLGYLELVAWGEHLQDTMVRFDMDGVGGTDYGFENAILLLGVSVQTLEPEHFLPQFDLVSGGGAAG